jgi:hypothetical protein
MTKEKTAHNLECKSDLHSEHLCYIVSQGFHLTDAEEYKSIVKDSKFKCRRCKRTAKSMNNLCDPEKS